GSFHGAASQRGRWEGYLSELDRAYARLDSDLEIAIQKLEARMDGGELIIDLTIAVIAPAIKALQSSATGFRLTIELIHRGALEAIKESPGQVADAYAGITVNDTDLSATLKTIGHRIINILNPVSWWD